MADWLNEWDVVAGGADVMGPPVALAGMSVETTAYPTSAQTSGSGGAAMDWGQFAQQSLSKTLDFFAAKDIAETNAGIAAQQRYYRVPGTGEVVPVGTAAQVSASANPVMLGLMVLVGIVALKAAKVV